MCDWEKKKDQRVQPATKLHLGSAKPDITFTFYRIRFCHVTFDGIAIALLG